MADQSEELSSDRFLLSIPGPVSWSILDRCSVRIHFELEWSPSEPVEKVCSRKGCVSTGATHSAHWGGSDLHCYCSERSAFDFRGPD